MSHLANPLALRLGAVTFWDAVWSSIHAKKHMLLFFEDLIFYEVFRWFFTHNLLRFDYIFSHVKILRTLGHSVYFLIFFYNSVSEKRFGSFYRNFALSAYNQKEIFNNFIHNLEGINFLGKWSSKLFYRKDFKYISLSSKAKKKKKKNIFKTKGIFFLFKSLISYYFTLHKNSLNLTLSVVKTLLLNKFILWKNKVFSFLFNKKASFSHLLKFSLYQVFGGSLNANILTNYVVTKLSQRFKLFRVIDPLLRTLTQLEFLLGFKVACSGRFTRKQIATYFWEKSGKLPLNTITQFIDYKYLTVTLKNSICGIKIWLCYPLQILKLKNLFKNATILNSLYE